MLYIIQHHISYDVLFIILFHCTIQLILKAVPKGCFNSVVIYLFHSGFHPWNNPFHDILSCILRFLVSGESFPSNFKDFLYGGKSCPPADTPNPILFQTSDMILFSFRYTTLHSQLTIIETNYCIFGFYSI